MSNLRKAQSTLEYIIVFTVIVGAILVAANGVIRTRMAGILDHVTTQAENAVGHIDFTGAGAGAAVALVPGD